MKNLYVGNLPHSTSESELRTLFQAHGEVQKVSIVTDRETGRARGFAFVEMTNPGEAEKAIAALNGTELGGRTLTINEAKPKQEKTEGSVDEMRELREHAEAQAALFRVGSDETNSAESSTADESRDIDQ